MLLIKDIILLLVGGLITFIGMYAIYRIKLRSERTPSLIWRKLPSVLLSNLGLTALSLSIENEGTKAAKNVRAVISIPDNVSIDSFEIETSEPAMRYDCTTSDNHNKIILNFPFFNKGLECIIAILAKKLNPSDVSVSIVGDNDVVGEEKQLIPDFSKLDKKIKIFDKIFSIVMILSLTCVLIYIFSTIIHLAYQKRLDIAEIYLQSGKYDLALKEYDKLPSELFIVPPTRLYYQLAKTYAMKNDDQKAIYYLKKVKQNDPDLAQFATVDESFDSIRKSEKMKEFLSQFK